ncbi:hypothetical protein [Kineococcus radiotolerans]|uniref:Heavy metal transporter n=1 Tax=Kineococcus radiotolerans (strain ATCC BAA-149 / DSM 14245 / SRS30216) TaxID=266940 RepID=A6W740_KINRD|nr:hypothetical protein [Kineococcus radiotolerans]ABS02629.1 conserved hypothetical protein [Kineococcus radiotolerans SRS30216 = ATCC BAA-149]
MPASPRPHRRPSPGARHTRRLRLAATLATVGVLATAGIVWITGDGEVPLVRERCSATVDGESTSMSPEQAANAATVVGIAVRRGLPARAATIGIATIVQESGMRNLDHGDRDSLGLFQQRPSQGWGTPEQVQDPVFATNAFYDALVEVDGYRDLPVTDAAQRVQRSGFPLAYGDHEPEARLVASALTGYTPGGFSCHLRPVATEVQVGGDEQLTPSAQAVADAAGAQVTILSPSVVEGAQGRALEYRAEGEDAARTAWAIAAWAVASAGVHPVTEVSVEGSRWSRDASGRGWVPTATGVPGGGVRISVG